MKHKSSAHPAARSLRHSSPATSHPSPFTPSIRQQQFAYFYISFPFLSSSSDPSCPSSVRFPSVAEVCRRIGIHRSTIYFWFKDPQFLRWWSYQFTAAIHLAAPRFAHSLLTAAEFGRTRPLSVFFRIYNPDLSIPKSGKNSTLFNEVIIPPEILEPPLPSPPAADAELHSKETDSTNFDISQSQTPSPSAPPAPPVELAPNPFLTARSPSSPGGGRAVEGPNPEEKSSNADINSALSHITALLADPATPPDFIPALSLALVRLTRIQNPAAGSGRSRWNRYDPPRPFTVKFSDDGGPPKPGSLGVRFSDTPSKSSPSSQSVDKNSPKIPDFPPIP